MPWKYLANIFENELFPFSTSAPMSVIFGQRMTIESFQNICYISGRNICFYYLEKAVFKIIFKLI